MISPVCDKCKLPLEDFGGLAFSPPKNHTVEKYHICAICWSLFIKFLDKDES